MSILRAAMLSRVDRRIIATLGSRHATLGSRHTRARPLRIAAVGNCQANGVGYAARMLVPRATVDIYPIRFRPILGLGKLAAALATYDIVLCSEFARNLLRSGGEALEGQEVVEVPMIAFTGFHPDFILLEQLRGPMGPFHSAIILFAFRAGLSLDEVESCFTSEVFGALQYFTTWEASKVEQVAAGHRVGVDLSRDVLRWTRRGCFMHNAIHPKAFVLFDLAKSALSRAGVPTCEVDFDDFAFDALAFSYICPIYPPIAAMLGVNGSYLFKRSDSRLKRHRGFIDLRRFIEASYDTYRRVPPQRLQHARVDAWLGEAETRRLFRCAETSGGC